MGRKQMLRTFAVAVMLSMLFCVSMGCATFSDKRLPIYNYAQIPDAPEKVDVSYKTNFISIGGTRIESASIELAKQVEEVINKSERFSNLFTTEGEAPYHFDITVQNKGNLTWAVAAGVISGITLMIIPTAATDHYHMTADVYRGDEVIKQYKYHDSMTTWFHLFLVFITFVDAYDSTTVRKEITRNMLMNFVHDLFTDQVLTANAPPET